MQFFAVIRAEDKTITILWFFCSCLRWEGLLWGSGTLYQSGEEKRKQQIQQPTQKSKLEKRMHLGTRSQSQNPEGDKFGSHDFR